MPGTDATLDAPVTLTLTVRDDRDASTGERRVETPARFRTRGIALGDKGDDVHMLEASLRQIGFAGGPGCRQGGCFDFGVLAMPLVQDGDYEQQTLKAFQDFQVAVGEQGHVQQNGAVDSAILARLHEAIVDYQLAFDSFSPNPPETIDETHPEFDSWIGAGLHLLDQQYRTYTAQLHSSIPGGPPYPEFLKGWVKKEDAYGHWGFEGHPYRVMLGSADHNASISFSQLQMKYKYSDRPPTGVRAMVLDRLNLFSPGENVEALATWVSDSSAPSFARGFRLAFITGAYRASLGTSSFPNLAPNQGDVYTDDTRDLLAKGVMSYNTGSGLAAYRLVPFPAFLRDNDPPSSSTPFGIRTAVAYTLKVQELGGFDMAWCWFWQDEAITTGADDKCDSVTQLKPGDVAVALQAGLADQICVVATAKAQLSTQAVGNDRRRVFRFPYCARQWLSGQGWAERRSAWLSTNRVLP